VPPEVRAVWQVARYLRERVDGDPHLRDLWIGGEVSNLTIASSGHMYFTLKDNGGALNCVFFRNQNQPHRQHMKAGVSLVAHGAVTFYAERGNLQFMVDFVQPAGVGTLQAEFERRKAQFEAEGLFEESRKRPLPVFPRRIGVVTSAKGAALHDIQTVLERRWPMATLMLQHAAVQGEEAAVDIADAIRSIAPKNDPSRCPDVLIVGRGGGSTEDLWAFNEEPVVRAIFGCPVPVVSAGGHETDTTLADLVADRRAPTPSAAAEMVAPDRVDVARHVQSLQARGLMHVSRRLAASSQTVDRTITRIERQLPDTRPLHRGITGRADSMMHAVHRIVVKEREQTAGLAARLRTLSPLATLDRGYALVAREDGVTPVPSVGDVQPGEAVQIRWRDGTRTARVESGQ
jgi:exodeoxyribonuclease VII large subunit